MSGKRLGFFTRLLDQGSAQERYRLATEQIVHAERAGFDTAWVAQHHFHADEGGLPSPLVFLAQAAARTRRIRLGTGVITLPMESALRVAEDTAVLDLLSDGRLEVGVAGGGTPSSFAAFGLDAGQRNTAFAENLRTLLSAWRGEALGGEDNRLYPAAPQLAQRVWQATFSVEGGERAGRAGDGLMLSRTQPRPADAPDLPLDELQNPIIDAYLAALPPGGAAHHGVAHCVCQRERPAGTRLRHGRVEPWAGADARQRPPVGRYVARRPDPRFRRALGHARSGNSLAATGQGAGARHRSGVSGALHRPAARPYSAFYRSYRPPRGP